MPSSLVLLALMLGICSSRLSDLVPVFSTDPGLTEDTGEEITTDVSMMWVGYAQFEGALCHKRVPSAGDRSLKAQFPQGADKVPLAYWPEWRH